MLRLIKKPVTHPEAKKAYDTLRQYCNEQVAIDEYCQTCIFDTKTCKCQCIVGCPGDWEKPKLLPLARRGRRRNT